MAEARIFMSSLGLASHETLMLHIFQLFTNKTAEKMSVAEKLEFMETFAFRYSVSVCVRFDLCCCSNSDKINALRESFDDRTYK